MKYIIRLFVGMVVFLAATSCHTSEIDNPDNTKPNGQPSDSELSITASIIQTRVTYSDSGDKLNQQWAVGDVLFGYIGGEAKEENRVSFTVSSVDPTTHIATLDAGSYKSTLLSSVDKVVDLVYTGQEQPYQADGSVNVTMSSQSANGKIPACMHSRATVTKENNVISLKFKFYNDCAIFEIVSLTGVNEENLSGSLQLTSIEATNLYQEGKYTLGENGFEFAGEEDSMGNVSLTLEGDWHVNTDGTITDGNTSRALMAVVPIAETDKKNIKFTSTTNTSQDFSFDYGAHKLEAGVCYVIGAKPVVAKTSDGQYFTSVSGAFEHAAALYKTAYNTAEKNIVTLLRDCGIAGVDASYIPITGGTASIDVDGYKATFDLNGHTLTFAGSSEYINVAKNSKLVITDSKSKSDNPGKIYSNTVDYYDEDNDGNGRDLVWNRGELIIEDAVLWHNQDMCAVVNTDEGILTVNGGKLISVFYTAIYSDGGTIDIYGGFIESRDEYETIRVLDGTVCTISGGVICSRGDTPTIGCRSTSPNTSRLTITWPTSQDDSMTDKEYGENIQEPLIYAAAPNSYPTYGFNNVPINAFNAEDGQGENTAKVNLQGGYLISNQGLLTFYSGDGGNTNDYYNLDFYNNDVGFYSNKEKITYHGSGNGNKKDFYNKGNGLSIKTGPAVIVKAESAGSGFTKSLNNIEIVTGALWYIYKKN